MPLDFDLLNSLPSDQKDAYIKSYISTVFERSNNYDKIATEITNILNQIACLMYMIKEKKISKTNHIYDHLYNTFFLKSDNENLSTLPIETILKIGQQTHELKSEAKDSENGH